MRITIEYPMDYTIAALEDYFSCSISLLATPLASAETQDLIPRYDGKETTISIDSRRLPAEILLRWRFPGERHFSPNELAHILLCSRMIGQKHAEQGQLYRTDLFRQFSMVLGKRSGESIVLMDEKHQVIYQNSAARDRRIVSRFEDYLQQTEDRLVDTRIEHTILLGGTAPLQLQVRNLYQGKVYLGRMITAVLQARVPESQKAPRKGTDGFLHILGKGGQLPKTLMIARKAALTDSTILLRGESGTGRNSSPGLSMGSPSGGTGPSSRSTVPRSRRTCSRVSSSAMRRDPSPVP